MSAEKLSSAELQAIDDEISAILKEADKRKYGYYPKDTVAAKAEFKELLTRIAECHDALIKIINDQLAGNYVPSGGSYQMLIKNYANAVKSLITLSETIERRKNVG